VEKKKTPPKKASPSKTTSRQAGSLKTRTAATAENSSRTGQAAAHPLLTLGAPAALFEKLRISKSTRWTIDEQQCMQAEIEGRDVVAVAAPRHLKHMRKAFVAGLCMRLAMDEETDRNPHTLVLVTDDTLAEKTASSIRSIVNDRRRKILAVLPADTEKPSKKKDTSAADVIVGTPDTVLQLRSRRQLSLRAVNRLAILEFNGMPPASRTDHVRRIIRSIPSREQRQTLLFLTETSKEIDRITGGWTRLAPGITGGTSTALSKEKTTKKKTDRASAPKQQSAPVRKAASGPVRHTTYIVHHREKDALLQYLLADIAPAQAIVLTHSPTAANGLAALLKRKEISFTHLKDNCDGAKKKEALQPFRAGETRILLTTGKALQRTRTGKVAYVINYNLPRNPRHYLERVKMLADNGHLINFACDDDSFYIPDIEAFIKKPLPCEHPDDAWLKSTPD
jgi:ATP-dependent RNA helicase RhlB